MNNNLNTAPIGHNQPPSELETIMNAVKERSEIVLFPLRNLMNKGKEEFSGIPITTPEQCSKVSDFTKELKSTAKKVEAMRVAEKEPFKAAGDAVHAYFKVILDSVDKMTDSLNQAITLHLNEELRKKRILDEAAAAEARKAAEAQLQNAVNLDNSGLTAQANNSLSKAQTNINAAQRLETTASARPADIVRTRGDTSLATLRTVWVGKITDKDKLDLNQLKPFISDADLQKFVSAFVRAGHRQLDGVSIYEESTAAIR